jgi:trimethylamine:corrinoid methyltransferase-like protein
MEERAAEQVTKILESHQPEPLPEDVKRDLAEFIKGEQSRMGA